jgi:hypothetical protein
MLGLGSAGEAKEGCEICDVALTRFLQRAAEADARVAMLELFSARCMQAGCARARERAGLGDVGLCMTKRPGEKKKCNVVVGPPPRLSPANKACRGFFLSLLVCKTCKQCMTADQCNYLMLKHGIRFCVVVGEIVDGYETMTKKGSANYVC